MNAAADAAAHSAAAADAWANSSMMPMGDEEAEAMAASVMPGISDSPPSPMATTATTKKRRGRKKKVAYKKNPYAPKRFKSSYIIFFSSKRPDIKKDLAEELGRDGTVSQSHESNHTGIIDFKLEMMAHTSYLVFSPFDIFIGCRGCQEVR